jgi:site-specific DNA-methyltransferase (adenine-specific)
MASKGLTDVCIVRLPACKTPRQYNRPLNFAGELIAEIAKELGPSATLIVLGEVIDLVQVQAHMPVSMRYQHWMAVKRIMPQGIDRRHLPHQHFGALVHTRYAKSLRHTKTRIKYTYCPVCDKTTKDYGGKKHTYHEVGTLISDVWRDISCDLDGDMSPVIDRFAALFGIDPYKELTIFDCRPMSIKRLPDRLMHVEFEENKLPKNLNDRILHGDCLEECRRIPSNSIDFAFADPPYNLGKKYLGYTDDLEIQDYFKWCDEWIRDLARVLKPGRTLALLNIPLRAVRHFLYMQTVLKFQNWIVWDALAFPVRLIMPAHYTILCFSKGESRELPGLAGKSKPIRVLSSPKTFSALEPLADGYCLRADCVDIRLVRHVNDRTQLMDVWGDIHRLKHNSRRVDHPCQLPPHLMYRLISIFTKPGESILDCFNGAGTTTLTAHQLNRKYIGIDSSEKYCSMAEERHLEIQKGIDPFRKEERVLTSKNSPVPRLAKQIYEIPKKALQLEVRRVAKQIGHIPTRDELIIHGKYSIDHYDKYFVSWGEVTAAARTTGMTEKRVNGNGEEPQFKGQLCLLDRSVLQGHR